MAQVAMVLGAAAVLVFGTGGMLLYAYRVGVAVAEGRVAAKDTELEKAHAELADAEKALVEQEARWRRLWEAAREHVRDAEELDQLAIGVTDSELLDRVLQRARDREARRAASATANAALDATDGTTASDLERTGEGGSPSV